jgi:hypothetical protein
MHRNFYGFTLKKFIEDAAVPVCECGLASVGYEYSFGHRFTMSPYTVTSQVASLAVVTFTHRAPDEYTLETAFAVGAMSWKVVVLVMFASLVVANTALAGLPSLDVRILTLAVAALAFAFEMVTRRTMKLVPTTDITAAALLTAFSGTGTAVAIAKLPNESG